ncbi:uncharacterized protein LOC107013425 [Solanum pennellii]|uniref:Uncharacterized protein LOC107013425 n=1 Tax=Solanum pennellii TaxID=28526 RepID=A0ABM1GBS5_SOLPN|nr:uncharacterized protein LOC107013425 [Solanum pennellii]
MGFYLEQVNKVMQMVTTVTYKFSHDGKQFENISPRRGLRQGDAISPYLFLIVAEGLSALLKRLSIQSRIHGVKICNKAPSISHLFFADDALYFFKAAKEEAETIKLCLEIYQAASGQQVNFQKSDIFFSPNTNESVKKEIVDILHVKEVNAPGKYLGLPAVIGRSKKSVFAYIHDRVIAKINNWKCTSLSRVGREVLLKTVVQSIPTYVMNMFVLPSNICEPVERAMNGFL